MNFFWFTFLFLFLFIFLLYFCFCVILLKTKTLKKQINFYFLSLWPEPKPKAPCARNQKCSPEAISQTKRAQSSRYHIWQDNNWRTVEVDAQIAGVPIIYYLLSLCRSSPLYMTVLQDNASSCTCLPSG